MLRVFIKKEFSPSPWPYLQYYYISVPVWIVIDRSSEL